VGAGWGADVVCRLSYDTRFDACVGVWRVCVGDMRYIAHTAGAEALFAFPARLAMPARYFFFVDAESA
jgi:hypothetical protein